jgi:hypothetical protein
MKYWFIVEKQNHCKPISIDECLVSVRLIKIVHLPVLQSSPLLQTSVKPMVFQMALILLFGTRTLASKSERVAGQVCQKSNSGVEGES